MASKSETCHGNVRCEAQTNHGRDVGSAANNSQSNPPSSIQDDVHAEPPVPDSFFRRGPANIDQSKFKSFPNPYRWPIITLNVGFRFNGSPIMAGPLTEDPLTRAKKIRALPMRESDIILTAFPKCGTHWVFEMVHMLLKGAVVLRGESKVVSMLEFIEDFATIEDLPSPRFFNSHLYLGQLPEQVVEKEVKLIHVYRNAKDTAVSWYHHMKRFFKPGTEELSFDNYLQGYMTDEYSTYGHQYDYERQMSSFEKAHPHHPIIHVRYEDLKEDPVPVLLEVSKFLGVEASAELCHEIAASCSFQNMRAAQREIPHHDGAGVYRKGIVGDWKNAFTVAQNRQFDEFIERQERKGGISYNLKCNY